MNKQEETCAGIYGDITDRSLSLSDGLQAAYSEAALAKDAEWRERVKPLVDAAELQVLNFKRLNLHPKLNFLGDDDYEAWGALTKALRHIKQEQPETEVKP